MVREGSWGLGDTQKGTLRPRTLASHKPNFSSDPQARRSCRRHDDPSALRQTSPVPVSSRRRDLRGLDGGRAFGVLGEYTHGCSHQSAGVAPRGPSGVTRSHRRRCKGPSLLQGADKATFQLGGNLLRAHLKRSSFRHGPGTNRCPRRPREPRRRSFCVGSSRPLRVQVVRVRTVVPGVSGLVVNPRTSPIVDHRCQGEEWSRY